MDDIRGSFSRMKKDIKHRLQGRKHKPDRTGIDTAGETVGSSGSLLRPESRIGVGGDDGEGRRTSTDGLRARLRNRSPHPDPIPAGGSDNDQQRGKAGVGGREVSKRNSHPELDIEVVVDNGPSREVEQVHPSPFPPVPPSGEHDSA